MRDRALRQALIVAADSGQTVATAELADSPLARMVGLLGRDGLDEGSALVLDPCRTIHTWFMRFPIDVVFLSDEGTVVRVFDDLPPFRYASGTRQARWTIELPAGARRRANISVGTHLRIDAA